MAGRITADAVLDLLVERIEACPIYSGGDTRIGFQAIDMTDVDGGIVDNRSRVFGWYILTQGASGHCFGGEMISVYLKIVYQDAVIHQDAVTLKNWLENHTPQTAGLGAFECDNTFIENNDIGEDKIYVYLPVTIYYLPPNLQDE